MEKKKILVVDDEENFVLMVKLNLEETGQYEVGIETEGAQALTTVKRFKPDLILLDIVIPDVGGEEIYLQLRSDRTLRNIPIIFLTAIVRENEVSSHRGMIGGHPFIAKPVTTEGLIECIKKTLNLEKRA